MLTSDQAVKYAVEHLPFVAAVHVLATTPNTEVLETAFDVHLSVVWDDGTTSRELFTVWTQLDGSLYGEW